MAKFVLPPCSVDGCGFAANAIVNEALLCSQHADTAIERVLAGREAALEQANTESDKFASLPSFNNGAAANL